jgi:hypothetical protein
MKITGACQCFYQFPKEKNSCLSFKEGMIGLCYIDSTYNKKGRGFTPGLFSF